MGKTAYFIDSGSAGQAIHATPSAAGAPHSNTANKGKHQSKQRAVERPTPFESSLAKVVSYAAAAVVAPRIATTNVALASQRMKTA